ERNLYEFVFQEGMKALDALLEQDRERMCGSKYTRGGGHEAVRWGSTEGRLVMGGRRVVVRRPRARKEGREVELPSWTTFADEDPLGRRTMEQMVIGVSTRNYERELEEVPRELAPHGASKSATSRRFVALTQRNVEEWLSSELRGYKDMPALIRALRPPEQTALIDQDANAA